MQCLAGSLLQILGVCSSFVFELNLIPHKAEYEDPGPMVRYKFSFQWCEEQGAPWWIQEPIKPGRPLFLCLISDLECLSHTAIRSSSDATK